MKFWSCDVKCWVMKVIMLMPQPNRAIHLYSVVCTTQGTFRYYVVTRLEGWSGGFDIFWCKERHFRNFGYFYNFFVMDQESHNLFVLFCEFNVAEMWRAILNYSSLKIMRIFQLINCVKSNLIIFNFPPYLFELDFEA